MKRIAVKFLLLLIVLSMVFMVLSIYHHYRSAKSHTDELIEQQAKLAMQYNLAIRQYVAEVIRPFLDKNLADCDFVPEVMSSSFISRRVFEHVQESFPDLVLKFSSITPRNPVNQADPDEVNILRHFAAHPESESWEGEMEMAGKWYYGIFTARRVKSECLHCHGQPQEAPQSLVAKYGTQGGFNHQEGDVIALDTVALPKDRIEASIHAQLRNQASFTLIGIILALVLTYYLFKRLISRPISQLSEHFDCLSSTTGHITSHPLPEGGNDEIGTLTRSFNSLTNRLQDYQSHLEQQVEHRTAELAHANRELSLEIIERRAAEESLRLNEKRLEAMLQLSRMSENDPYEIIDFALAEAVKLTDSEAGYLFMFDEDGRLEGIFFRSVEEGAGCRWPTVHQAADDPLLARLAAEGKAVFCNAPNHDDNSIFENVLLCPSPIRRHLNVPIVQGGGVVAIAGTVNKQGVYDGADLRQMTLLLNAMCRLLRIKRAEREKEQLSEQLQQARKMEAIGRLAGGIAHDFNNILTGIAGYADLLSIQGNIDSPVGQSAYEIKKAAERASRLTNQLLTFSRRQTSTPRVIELNRAINESLPVLARTVGGQIEVQVLLSGSSCPVRIDPDQFHQILFNLAGNAAEAMPEGGRLTIETRLTRLDRASLGKFPQTRPGLFVELIITDAGGGIDPAIIDQIFEPFFTTKEFGRSSGFGLAAVWGIVEQAKGAIEVESQLGGGSTFRIYLPFWAGEASDMEAEPGKEKAAMQETVMIVDDNEMMVNLTKRVLTDQGYQVITAPNSMQALDLFDRERPDIQLLITDVTMPEMDGIELHKRLAQRIPQLRVIYMSGFSEEYIDRASLTGDGKHFIQKPFSIDAFTRKVQEALRSPVVAATSSGNGQTAFKFPTNDSSLVN